ncbi:hypothetical protein K461DRAFT_281919 [Myriangium duriaei CBS 260.36]|uniref:HMA domain-containing protein n=1 Tax=Myriangium duriaei CBS 260.36 TaxID=1168546 RepID=A0A9P4MD56_9PEZI|nr:hypothetical protein K461DRAFT_281919 [Myriangium duriaei CBS 260.36]
MSDHTYELEVQMSCSGCSDAVTKILDKMDGVKSKTIDLEEEQVKIVTEPSLNHESIRDELNTSKTVWLIKENGKELYKKDGYGEWKKKQEKRREKKKRSV